MTFESSSLQVSAQRGTCLFISLYCHLHSYVAISVESLYILVLHPDASFAAACAYAFRENSAMKSNIVESRHVKPEEEWPVCSQSHPLAILEVVLPRCGIVHLYDLECAFGCLVVTDACLVAEVGSTCHRATE